MAWRDYGRRATSSTSRRRRLEGANRGPGAGLFRAPRHRVRPRPPPGDTATFRHDREATAHALTGTRSPEAAALRRARRAPQARAVTDLLTYGGGLRGVPANTFRRANRAAPKPTATWWSAFARSRWALLAPRALFETPAHRSPGAYLSDADFRAQ